MPGAPVLVVGAVNCVYVKFFCVNKIMLYTVCTV